MEHLDVLIVGAGLSGVAAAYHLQQTCPGRSYAILEGRSAMGGTWDLFRYPGIRSDSDMFTLGFPFRPWTGEQSIAEGASIRRYIEETAEQFGIDRQVRFRHQVLKASWSSEAARWTVTVDREGAVEELSCAFLFMCSGYYDYTQGYTPEIPGLDDFGGQVVHPQFWPKELDCSGRRVVVIGSGATAITLVPELARVANRVVMLQRSPSYVLSLPSKDPLAPKIRERLPGPVADRAIRWKNIALATASYQLSQRMPRLMKKGLMSLVRRQVGEGVDVETHFNPHYGPWDQRLCVVPDGDLFRELREGRAEVVTGHIEKVVERGIRLRDGRTIEADLIVTATGLRLRLLGGMSVEVDGRAMQPNETLSYKGIMCSGVPNMAMVFGYVNASWTLKCDLACDYVARLLAWMDERGHRVVTPVADPAKVRRERLLPMDSGYFLRALKQLPAQGHRSPWRMHQNYLADVAEFRLRRVNDEGLEFR